MTTSLQEHVAREVRAELGRQRMTQGALAAALGRSEAYTTRRLSGEVAFKLDELEHVADILRVPVTGFIPLDRADARYRPAA